MKFNQKQINDLAHFFVQIAPDCQSLSPTMDLVTRFKACIVCSLNDIEMYVNTNELFPEIKSLIDMYFSDSFSCEQAFEVFINALFVEIYTQLYFFSNDYTEHAKKIDMLIHEGYDSLAESYVDSYLYEDNFNTSKYAEHA